MSLKLMLNFWTKICFVNIFLIVLQLNNNLKQITCSIEEEKLIKNLFKGYNKLIRPVKNSSDHVVITMDLVLLQLINVYEKEQIMKTNVWINLKWRDFQLNWTASDYKVGSVRVPHDRVWTPDIVLFNNADGNYEASYKPNVVLYSDTDESTPNILWIPPAIYKSSCTIDVRYFPFDEQLCEMRFGSWTFDAQQVKLKREKPMVNLEDYLPSGTWDVIGAPGFETYSNETNRMELVYHFRIRRKTLFYTVNLIIPTVLISFLSIFVFYLPTDEGEKMTLCISILLALVVFLLLVSKILPPTSMVIPLISKYLIFTLMMNIITILNTVIIINWNYRTPRTHTMPKWVRFIFIEFLPIVLCMKRPEQNNENNSISKPCSNTNNTSRISNYLNDKPSKDFNETKDLLVLTTTATAAAAAASSTSPPVFTKKSKRQKNISLDINEDERHGLVPPAYKKRENMYSSSNCNLNNEFGANNLSSSLIRNKKSSYENSLNNLNKQTLCSTNSNHNQAIRQRPKQQQHKNLDRLAKNSKSHKQKQIQSKNILINSKNNSLDSTNFNRCLPNTKNVNALRQIPIIRDNEIITDNNLGHDDELTAFIRINKANESGNPANNLNLKQINFKHFTSTSINTTSQHQHHIQKNRSLSRENSTDKQQKQYQHQKRSSSSHNRSQTNLVNRASRPNTRPSRQQAFRSQTHSRSLEYNGSDIIHDAYQNSTDDDVNNHFDGDADSDDDDDSKPVEFSSEIIEAADKVTYITNHMKSENDYEEMRDDWKYVALVIDRLQLYIFFSVTVIGTAFILFDAPHIFEFVDQQEKLKKLIAENKF